MSNVRVLACGDRNWNCASIIVRVLQNVLKPGDVLVHGAARGADTLAGQLAAGVEGVTIEAYPANWKLEGRAAGMIRNQRMLDTGIDLVLAFHDDLETSKGTKDMVRRARRVGIEVKVFTSVGEQV